MKSFILSLSIVSMYLLNAPVSRDLDHTANVVAVYICVSKTASKYHYSQSCTGLNRCSHKIEKVSISDAKNRGYSLCGFED
jgi:hypothetical protein